MSDEPEHRHVPHRTPTRALPHEQKIARQQGHIRILTGVILLVLALLAYAAAFDLDSGAEWIVFVMIIVTAIGATIAVHSKN
jgi:hypothetical protein